MDFSKLKKNRGQSLQAMTKKLEDMNSSSSYQDERIWKPPFDKKAGKGFAIVRFLPSKFSEDGVHFEEVHYHNFQGRNGWYVQNSRKTLGRDEPDPASDSFFLHHRVAKEKGDDSYKKKAKGRNPRQKYYANILVIKDSENPENEGQVRIFEFGPKIFGMLTSKMKPEFEDDKAIDPFDMWDGCNFIIRVTGNEMPDSRNPGKKIVVPNYDTSSFDTKSELFEDEDEKKEEVFNKTYNLNEFTELKTFDELAELFKKATGEEWNYLEHGDEVDAEIAKLEQQAKDKKSLEDPVSNDYDVDDDELPTDSDTPPFETDEEDEALAAFQRMAKG